MYLIVKVEDSHIPTKKSETEDLFYAAVDLILREKESRRWR